MKVFVVAPEMTISDTAVLKSASDFYTILQTGLKRFGIEEYLIQEFNYKKLLLNLDSKSMLIVFNGDIKEHDELYKTALNNSCIIHPVAIDRLHRDPDKIIHESQSFDVYEQLRSRDLSNEYINIAAESFTRIVVSECIPTILSNELNLFLSHRRLDGEEITASVCDVLQKIEPQKGFFRDIINVKVGENAQKVIDEALSNSDILVFFHTEHAANSDWILKELFYAIIHNIPVLWIRIGDPDNSRLKYKPSAVPQLQYSVDDFSNQDQLKNIADQILQKSFELLANKLNDVYDEISCVQELLGANFDCCQNDGPMIYHVKYPRKGYRYPQRTISQLVQFYGRKPKDDDISQLSQIINQRQRDELDSAVMLSNRIISREIHGNVLLDNYENFKGIYDEYINGKKEDKPYEIVISGAFPDSDEIYQQNLTYALICFEKEILRNGFILCFGAHPTFQDLIFDTAASVTDKSTDKVKMYILKRYCSDEQLEEFRKRCSPFRTEEETDNIDVSLTRMRKEMIARESVKALICLGGKIKTDQSKEGVREEIKIAQDNGVPVFIIASTGGCTSQIAELYSRSKNWNELNSLSFDTNEQLKDSLDYQTSARIVIDAINKKLKREGL